MMSLPPLNLASVKRLTVVPRPVAENLFTSGSGYLLESDAGPVAIAVSQKDGFSFFSYDDAKRFFDLDIKEATATLLDVMVALGVEAAPIPDREAALLTARDLLESARWIPVPEGDLPVHDLDAGITYILNAFADPVGYLGALRSASDSAPTTDAEPTLTEVIEPLTDPGENIVLPSI
jgi:hypothetical protein